MNTNHLLSSAILMLGLVSILSCTRDDAGREEVKDLTDSLQQSIDHLRAENDSLQQLLVDSAAVDNWFNPDLEGRKFLKQGITDPESFIKETLRNRPDLIPLEPVLGGTMRFVKIQVLGNQWVVAEYEDGHIRGRTIYEYQLTPDGKLTFNELATEKNP